MNNLKSLPKTEKLHIALGAFDGIHSAHVAVINNAVKSARAEGGKSLILSFEPLPKEYFLDKIYPGRLLPMEIKERLLSRFGADFVVIEDFETMHSLSEADFIRRLLACADELHFYAGRDFHIGCPRGEKYEGEGVFIHHRDDILIGGRPCRSTEIRKLIREGQMPEAASLLGREYVYYSHTIGGSQIGRTINFPTINLSPTNQVLPQSGVYFGEISINGGIYPSAVYVGTRPTLNGDHIRIEAHSVAPFPDKETPRGTPAALRFIRKIFEEKGFESLAKLQEILYNYKNVSSALAAERYKNKPAPSFEEMR